MMGSQVIAEQPKIPENDSLSIVNRTRDQRLLNGAISDYSSMYQRLRAFLFR